MEYNSTYKDYDYPQNLLVEIMGENALSDYDAATAGEKLDAMIATLPERMQTAIEQRYRYRQTYQNIGNLLGISNVSCRTVVQKAIRLLRHPTKRKLLFPQSPSEKQT